MYRRPLGGFAIPLRSTWQSLAVRQACYRIFAVVIDFVEQYYTNMAGNRPVKVRAYAAYWAWAFSRARKALIQRMEYGSCPIKRSQARIEVWISGTVGSVIAVVKPREMASAR